MRRTSAVPPGARIATAGLVSVALRAIAVVAALLVAWFGLQLLLMLFAGVLLAIFLRTLARWLADATGMRIGWSLAAVVLGLLGIVAVAGMLYAPRLAEESDRFTQTLPQSLSQVTSWLRTYTWGQWLIEQVSPSASGDSDVGQRAATALRRITHGLVAAVVILFTGLYLAAEPEPYVRGLLRLLPRGRRRRGAEVLYAIGHVLRWWLFGQALAMLLVGLTMGIGLWLIGVPMALLLGVLAGIFEFVPFVGPVMALGPALVLGLAEGTRQAGYVLLLYGLVQTLEGYVLTPLVQRKAVELPPVITIAAQVALSWAAGAIGLLVAVPLTASILVATQMLYVEDRLGDDVTDDVESAAVAEVEADAGGMLKDVLSS